MPHGDRTGPQGAGSMTGRGMGHCAGYAQPGFANPGAGFTGMGRGPGMGRGGSGFRNQFHATGLTGWQRAGRGMQAWGAAPVATAAMPAASGEAVTLDDLRARADRLERELAEVREALEHRRTE